MILVGLGTSTNADLRNSLLLISLNAKQFSNLPRLELCLLINAIRIINIRGTSRGVRINF
jgi:hypothetical protein